MRRIPIAAALVVAVIAALALAWFAMHRAGGSDVTGAPPPGDARAAYAATLPTGPISCPDDPNDLAGIEGWAPGAGKASQMGSTGVGNLGGFGSALGGGTPDTPAPVKTCTGLKPEFANAFDTVADRIKTLPTGDFDPAVRGADFATPDDAYAFVRDSVATEGYPGAMRGATGTLQSHGGSSADKSLLLGALLEIQHVPVRYVHARLTDADAQTMLASIAQTRPAIAEPQLDDVFKQLGIDPVRTRANAAALRARVESDANDAISEAKTETDTVLASFAAAQPPVTLASESASSNARLTAEVRDHWWLQAQIGGAWVDLDPSVAGAAKGTHLGAQLGDPSDDLPATAIRTITVRLTADRFDVSGAPATTTLVEKTLPLTDTYAEPLSVTIGDRSVGSASIGQAAAFTPTIGFAGGETGGDPFDTKNLAVVRLQVETALGTTVQHVASRIVLDARTPAGSAIAPEWTPKRYAFGLTTVYQILPVAGEVSEGFAARREATGMQTLRAFMAYAAAGGNGKQMPPPGIAETYPLAALRYFEYDSLVRRLIEDGSKGTIRLAFDHPQVAIERHAFDPAADSPTGIEGFDIADNSMLALGSDRAAAVRANVTRGYVDTRAESALFATPGDGGTIAVFAAAKAANVGLTVLRGDRYGGIALAPSTPVALAGTNRVGWWAIDPADGNLVGRMAPDGAGQELAEYAIARANDWSTLYGMLQFYGDFFRCIAGAVEAPLAGARAQSDFEQCAGAAICSYLEMLSVGEAYSRWGSDEQALLYNIFDLSVPGSKDSWPPSGGAACGLLFTSPLYP